VIQANIQKPPITNSEQRDIVGYVRISTDYQDIGKQKDTIAHWARREGLKDPSDELNSFYQLPNFMF
jgi:hypothetical protein